MAHAYAPYSDHVARPSLQACNEDAASTTVGSRLMAVPAISVASNAVALQGKPAALLADVVSLTRSDAARKARRRLRAKRTF